MKNNLKIVFIGTAAFAVNSLQGLLDLHYNIPLVISQPDREKGRGRVLAPTPIKEAAVKNNLLIFQPEKINSQESISVIKNINPDVIVVVAYGQLVKQQILDIPKLGCINIHGSLLPKLRGAAPINWSIINGDNKTGVTSMFMDAGMDTGDMLLKSEIEIDDAIDAVALVEKLSELGSEVLVQTLELLKENKLMRTKQDNASATYAPILKKEDGLISFADKDAKEIHNMVRGLAPWPAAYTFYEGKLIKLLKTSYNLSEDVSGFIPGTIIKVNKESFTVSARKGTVEIYSLQPQDKKVMTAKDFINGYRIDKGQGLGVKGSRNL